MKIKTIFKPRGILFLVSLGLIFFACNSFYGKNDPPTLIKTFHLDEAGILNAKSSGGSVIVTAHDNDEVEIQIYVRKKGKVIDSSNPDLNKLLNQYKLDFSQDGQVINAIVKRKKNWSNAWNNVGIALNILVPKNMTCNVTSSGGRVKVSGVSGTLHKMVSSGGSVKLADINGNCEATSSGGSVKAENINGDMRLVSSGGGVYIDNSQGNMYAHSSGGGVHLNNVHGSVEAGSSGGSVTVQGETPAVTASSSGGSVKVDIYNLSKALSLSSSGGGIYATIHDGEDLGLNLDLKSQRVDIKLKNFTGTNKKGQVNGIMNNGGIPVYMHSSGGNVHVNF